jgi:molybdenum cofactor biosynthesis enzyme MoaA
MKSDYEYPEVSEELHEEEWKHFNSNRTIPEKDKFIACYAPFNHMRIRRDGMMSPCCFALVFGKWEKGKFGLKDYWFGDVNNSYRESFLDNEMGIGCRKICGTAIRNKVIPPINDYDWNWHDRSKHAMDSNAYPKVIEFEISNLCNMACPMCMGELSSKHMLGRDKDLKTYAPNLFDNDQNLEELLDQLKEFIPHLRTIRFTGGEPFAHKAFYKIAQMIADVNPTMEVDVTTNGSIYNTKVDKFVGLLKNMKISVSLDTVDVDDYAKIRIGGIHKETMANIEKFKNKLGAANIKINSTIMSLNCANIDKFFAYANANGFTAFVNRYERAGREHTIDYNINLMPKEVLENTIVKLNDINPRINREAVKRTIKLIEKAISEQ